MVAARGPIASGSASGTSSATVCGRPPSSFYPVISMNGSKFVDVVLKSRQRSYNLGIPLWDSEKQPSRPVHLAVSLSTYIGNWVGEPGGSFLREL